MRKFREEIYKLEYDVIPQDCVRLLFFDYKGVGDITFNFIDCTDTPNSYTFENLPNSGGTYITFDVSGSIPEMPCYKNGTLVASIANVNNFITELC